MKRFTEIQVYLDRFPFERKEHSDIVVVVVRNRRNQGEGRSRIRTRSELTQRYLASN